jgi:emericellamide synthase (highly reducing iterative type I polyketide synthase)
MNIGQSFGQTLDFLILTSSVAGIIGTYGSSAYAAANTFQDAFARHHSSRGIPIRAINLGLITTGGVVADRSDAENVMSMLVKQGALVTTMEEVLALINYAIQDVTGKHTDDAQMLCRLRKVNPNTESEERINAQPDARFSHIWVDPSQDKDSGNKSDGQRDIQQALGAALTPVAVIEATLSAIKGKISQLLAIPEIELQSDRSIVSYGVDSLVSVELRNWIVAQLSAHVQMTEVLSSKPMIQIAEMLARRSRYVNEGIFGGKESTK